MTTRPELTEAERERRRAQAHTAITNALTASWPRWRRTGRRPDFTTAAGYALDGLGDLAAEILIDGTMLRSLDIHDGVATLSLEPATEILKVFVASMRGVLDGHGAENYLEAEMSAPKVSMDLRDGDNPMDDYTVTIQRRARPTPHEFRQRAEAARDEVLRIVAAWCAEANDVGGVDAGDLAWRLQQAGHALPEQDDDARAARAEGSAR